MWVLKKKSISEQYIIELGEAKENKIKRAELGIYLVLRFLPAMN